VTGEAAVCHFRSALVLAVFVALVAGPTRAQEDVPPRVLSGTLAKVHKSGVVTLGYREASFPFSYVDADGDPLGYSIDLCRSIVESIGRAIDKPQLRTQFELVTPETRIPALLSGKVDLVCGSATDTAERRKQVAFSPITFFTGTKLMVRRDSGLRSIANLTGKVIVVTAGTTNASAILLVNEKRKLGISLVTAPDHERSYQMVVEGKADAFASDEILLYGLIARHAAQREFIVVGDFLSYDPYALMFRRDDPQLAEVVRQTFRDLAEDRDLIEIYHRWFIRRTPSGERLNLPINAQLLEVFRALGMPE
jgi:glutamate/aspartate transport system substrate-binding protein